MDANTEKNWKNIIGALERGNVKGAYTLAESASIANSVNVIRDVLCKESPPFDMQAGLKKKENNIRNGSQA